MRNKNALTNTKGKQIGITLIALIITIIIMLILAGVTISVVINGGLFSEAQEAGAKTTEESGKEEIFLAISAMQGDELGNINLEFVENNIEEYTENRVIAGEIVEDGLEVYHNNGYVYIIDENLQIIYSALATGIRVGLPKQVTFDGATMTATITAAPVLRGEIGEVTVTSIQMEEETPKLGESATFEVTENGEYKFTITLSDGSVHQKKVKVTEIVTLGKIMDLYDEERTNPDGVHVGDFVNYTPDDTVSSTYVLHTYRTGAPCAPHTREILQWQVLDNNGPNGEVRLISSQPTKFQLALAQDRGYSNAVRMIDEICGMYGGAKALNAQGLKIEDIQNHMLETNYSNITPDYGTSLRAGGAYYPSIFEEENNQLGSGEIGGLGLSEQDEWYDGVALSGKPLNIVCTYWTKEMVAADWTNNQTEYQNMLIMHGSGSYWLSSRCVDGHTVYAHYRLYRQIGYTIDAPYLYLSSNSGPTIMEHLRPVITLKPDVELTGKTGETWNLK